MKEGEVKEEDAEEERDRGAALRGAETRRRDVRFMPP